MGRGRAGASPAFAGGVGHHRGRWALRRPEERALGGVRRMLAEENPELAPFDQEALAEERRYLDLDLGHELARLEQLRRDHLAVLTGWTGQGGSAVAVTGSTAS